MKKAVLILVLLASMFTSWAYDFSAVAPTGQTLYYSITSDSTVGVVRPDDYYDWIGFPQPTDTLIIPSTVVHAGTTYTVTAICRLAFWCCDSLTAVTIPNTVTAIGSSAFAHCRSLVSVNIPSTIPSIGNSTFHSCSSLTSIVIPSSVTSIGDYAFLYCGSLANVTIPASVTSIGTSAFSHCSSLTSVAIPNSVTSIGENAFRDCVSLTSITIPTSVTTIGVCAFCHCSSLPSVAIPSSVTAIPEWAFDSCISLTSVSIPNSVTSISRSAFRLCLSLDSVVIPSSVTSISNYAFHNCSNLTAITCKASVPPTLGNDVFWAVPASANVYVPCGSTASYQSSWTYFSNFIESSYSITVASADTTRGSVSVTTQPSCDLPAIITATPYAGCRFLHWSDGNTDNPRSVALTQDTFLLACFAADRPLDTVYIVIHDTLIPAWHTLSVVSDDTDRGLAAGSGLFPEGTIVEIAAIPVSGSRFVQWQDGNTDNPRRVTLMSDTTFVATFDASGTEGITDVDIIRYTVTTEESKIIVNDAPGMRIRIFDSLGRCLSTSTTADRVRVFRMPTAGLYMVQVADHPAQKVIVVD